MAQVDAVLCPVAKVKGATESDRLEWFKSEFGPVLGSKRVFGRHVPGGKLLLTAGGESTPGTNHLYHHDDHPRAGQERYVWVDSRGDGILYGTLEPDDAPA